MPLQTTFRPTTLEEIVGNEVLVNELRSKLDPKLKDPPHTFLITGPSGCGKTTIAQIIKTSLNCSSFDFFRFNASNTRGIDTVREVIETMNMSPMKGNIKIYFFDECHQLTTPAQEAFLKETEQPPNHVYFIFCTTEPEKLKETFKRRALQLNVTKLMRGEVLFLLKRTLQKVGKQGFPTQILTKIATSCDGSPGQALKLLDSVLDMTNVEEALKAVENAIGREGNVLELCRALVSRDMNFEQKWSQVQSVLKNADVEAEVARKAILTYLEKAMLGNQASDFLVRLIDIFEGSMIYSYKAGLIGRCYVACKLEV